MTETNLLRKEYKVIVTPLARFTCEGELPGVHDFGNFKAKARDPKDLGALLAGQLDVEFLEHAEKLNGRLPQQTYAAKVGSQIWLLYVAYNPQDQKLSLERFYKY